MIEKSALYALLRLCRNEIRARDRRIKQLKMQLTVANHIIREQAAENAQRPLGVPTRNRLPRS